MKMLPEAGNKVYGVFVSWYADYWQLEGLFETDGKAEAYANKVMSEEHYDESCSLLITELIVK